MADTSISYLLENNELKAKTLIEKGEGIHIEFKKSYTLDGVKTKIFQMVAAFLNTEGGTLFIGVNDDKKVVGIKPFSYKIRDKLFLDITNRLKQFGADILDYVHVIFEDISGKIVARIDVNYVNRAVFMPGKAENYFIRKHTSTIELNKMETYKHLKKRGVLQ